MALCRARVGTNGVTGGTMPLYRPRKAEYIQAVKALRRGIEDPITGESTGRLADGFDAADGYDLRKFDEWTPAQKAKVTRLYNLVDELTARPFYVYRGRKPENIRLMQEVAQHEQFPSELKVAFLPSPARIKPKIRITKKREVVIKQGRITRRAVVLEDVGLTPEDFAIDPKGSTEQALESIEPGKAYQIKMGKYLSKRAYSKGYLPKKVAMLVEKYGADTYDPDDPSSSYFGNWLKGFEVYQFERREDFDRFREQQTRSKEALKEERERARRRWRRKYGRRRKRK